MAGAYSSAVDTPSAPWRIIVSTSAVMWASSAGVARRSSLPTTASRSCVAPTKVAMFTVEPFPASTAK